MLSLLFSMINPALGTAYTLGWDLVDSGKHLDWGGSTKYQNDFNYSVNTWNNYKSGVIRKDSIIYLKDVTISDITLKNNDAGETDGDNKTIKFNTFNIDPMNTTRRRNVCAHELGHALGLNENPNTGNTMYYKSSDTYTLSRDDKDSYNAAVLNW
ncbi:MAG: matrixin family metalloprotease [Methanosarcinales archaeon]|nr:matrixin family metalloprotease [Methanosarcinales archaeon]